MTMRWSTT